MLLLRLPVVAATSVAAYVYPLYASYKAITAPARPGSTAAAYSWRVPRAPAAPAPPAAKTPTELAQLETWLMYWSVIALVQTAETFFGWSWSWYVPCPGACPFIAQLTPPPPRQDAPLRRG